MKHRDDKNKHYHGGKKAPVAATAASSSSMERIREALRASSYNKGADLLRPRAPGAKNAEPQTGLAGLPRLVVPGLGRTPVGVGTAGGKSADTVTDATSGSQLPASGVIGKHGQLSDTVNARKEFGQGFGELSTEDQQAVAEAGAGLRGNPIAGLTSGGIGGLLGGLASSDVAAPPGQSGAAASGMVSLTPQDRADVAVGLAGAGGGVTAGFASAGAGGLGAGALAFEWVTGTAALEAAVAGGAAPAVVAGAAGAAGAAATAGILLGTGAFFYALTRALDEALLGGALGSGVGESLNATSTEEEVATAEAAEAQKKANDKAAADKKAADDKAAADKKAADDKAAADKKAADEKAAADKKKKEEEDKKKSGGGGKKPDEENRYRDRYGLVGGSRALNRQKDAKKGGSKGWDVTPNPDETTAVSNGVTAPSSSQVGRNLFGQPGNTGREGGVIHSGINYGGKAGATDLGRDQVNNPAGGRSEDPGSAMDKAPQPGFPPRTGSSSSSSSSTSQTDTAKKPKSKRKKKVQ